MASLRVDRKTLCKGLPYHIIVDKDLTIVQLEDKEVEVKEYSDLRNILDKKVIIAMKKRNEDKRKTVRIRGLFTEVLMTSSLMFLGSPCVSSLGEMRELGLCLSDIPIHDATRDLVLFDKAAEAQDRMKRRMENLQVQIRAASEEADEERKRNIVLLEMLFPPDIAQRLWQGQTIEPQRHDDVTLLFSDLVGFTGICSTATPSEVVQMLRTLYSEFDRMSGILDVYKLETIGDAYCCASGLNRSSDCKKQADTATMNAVRIAWMGLEMLRCVVTATDHRGQILKMRVGIHSGTVLTGVVGRKMPKYCLFGSDVTIANQMESTSESGRLHASPITYQHLAEYGGFVLEPRDTEYLPKALQGSETKGGFVNLFSREAADNDEYAGATFDSHEAIMREVKLGT